MSASTVRRVRVTFPGGKRVDATWGTHLVRTDQALEHGGEGSAPEPFDLFLASLATCAGAYVQGFCQARGISTSGIAVAQESSFEDGKLAAIRLEIELPPEFPEKYANAVRAAALGCRVKKVLAAPPPIAVEVRHGDAQPGARAATVSDSVRP